MQLSLHADYACRVLIFLAASKNDRTSIQEIADAFRISENHLVKVVHRLGKFGFLDNTRGRGGGISLAKDPSDIRIGDVIRTMEPHFDIVECFNDSSNGCPITRICGLKEALAVAKDAFLSSLDKVTLAQISANHRALNQVLRAPNR